ncbi:unnamed protein product, partial [Polarella glacialis]
MSAFGPLLVNQQEPLLKFAEEGDLAGVQRILGEASEADRLQKLKKLRDEDSRTALHRACAAGHKEVAAYLLSQGAVVNVEDDAGWTPLHSCASKGADVLLDLLLEAKADCDTATSTGSTALHFAASKGHQDALRSLLAAGAKRNPRDHNG